MSTIIQSGQIYSGNTLTADQVIVLSEGSAVDNIINSGGILIISGGVGVSTEVNSGGAVIVNDYGSSLAATISNGGTLTVDTGGVANGTGVYSGGNVTVNNFGRLIGTDISPGGNLIVNSGANINSTWISSGASVTVNSGANVITTWISSGASVTVNSGGKIYSTQIYNGGQLNIDFGGIASSTQMFSGANLTANSGAILRNTTINTGANLTINSGITISSTTINSNGNLNINNGGIASVTSINSSGILTINSGGVASITSINSGGILTINSGGAAYNNIINNGILDIRSGAIYSGNNFGSNGGSLVINSGINWDETSLKSIGAFGSNISYIVNSGALFKDITIEYNGAISVNSGGFIVNDIIDGGTLQLNSGAIVHRTSFTSNGGSLILDSGFIATTSDFQNLQVNSNVNTIVRNGAIVSKGSISDLTMIVNRNGSAVSTTINSGGNLTINSGGFAYSNNVYSTGNVTINSGGTANIISVNRGGNVVVNNGGITSNTTVNSGGIASNTTVNSSGSVTLNSGGTANIISVNTNGNLIVNNGGNASNTIVNSNGNLIINSGGTVFDNTLNGGILTINSGGAIFGNIINSGTLDISYGGLYYGSGFGSNGGRLVLNSGVDWSKSALETYNALGSNMHYVVNSATSYNNATIGSEGGLSIHNGGSAFNDIIDGGILQVGSGAILSQTSFTSNGGTLVFGSGFNGENFNINNIKINSNVELVVQSAAIAQDMHLSNISITVSAGGKLLNNTIDTLSGVYTTIGGTASGNIFSCNPVSGMGLIQVKGGGSLDGNTIIGVYLGYYNGGSINNNNLYNTSLTVYGSPNYPYVQIQFAKNNTLYDGAELRAANLGRTSNNIVNSGGKIVADGGAYAQYGGYIVGNTINSGGILEVNGGTANNNTINSGSIVIVSRGDFFNNTLTDATLSIVNNVNTMFNPSNATNHINGGSIYISNGRFDGQEINNATINLQGSNFFDGNSITSSIITVNNNNGSIDNNLFYNTEVNVSNGAFILGNIFNSGSLLNVYSGGSLKSNTIISAGASAVLYDGATLSGTLTLNSGGYVVITTSTGGIVNLVDNTIPVYLLDQTTTLSDFSTGLVISGTGSATTVISGFTGKDSDQITLANVQTSNVVNVTYPDVDHVTFTLNDGTMTTLNITGVGNYGYALGSDSNGNVVYEVCFLTGTMITIPNGICAVEELTIGDLVLVYDPVTQTKVSSPIKWIGHKKVSVKPNLHSDEAGYPVRILKDAIAQNVPNKDLLITPEHCLYFNDKFVPVRMLVNGYSIFYDTSITSYDYYHIETEEHSILTADGTLTESYLDTGNRHTFNQDQKVIELSGDKVKTWQEDAIAPLTVERSFVEGIYNNILQRTNKHNYPKQKQPFELTQDPDICLMTNQGEFIYKEVISTDKKPIFILPNTINAVWVISRTSRPCDVIGPFIDDRRYLGVLVGDITLQRNSKNHLITTHIETDHLLGWNVKETVPCRWTKGKAFLPLNIKSHSNTPTILTLNILSEHSYIIDQVKDNKKQA